MIALRLLLVAAMALALTPDPYDQEDVVVAYKLSDCLKLAITDGIPSLDIPSHNPFVLGRNLSWNGDIGIASIKFNLTDLTWYGIPTWSTFLAQFTSDIDNPAEFFYRLSWDRFVITSKYSVETNVVLIPPGRFNGDLNITLDGITWEGGVIFNKPGHEVPEGLEELILNWNLTQADFNFTGLGLLNEPISSSLGTLFVNYFQSGVLANDVGYVLKDLLNTVWFAHNERIEALLAFCKANGTLSN